MGSNESTDDTRINGGKDAKFDCHTMGGSGTGTGTQYSTGYIDYDQCHFEIPKEAIINLGNDS